MPERLSLLKQWLVEECNVRDFTLKPASEDASFRRYFRIQSTDGDSMIVMDAPPNHENCVPFITIGERLRAAGIHAPEIYAKNLEQGFLLLEDLGDEQYLPNLRQGSIQRLYGDALSALMAMQACVPAEDLPPYDRELLLREMQLFPQWLLQQHLRVELNESQSKMLADTMELLIENALAQPKVFVHRDYHSRNLMVSNPPKPGVLDFQDAVYGPITYDLVSLLRDCYVSWEPELVDSWAMGYFDLCVQSGLLSAEQEADFLRWFDLMGAQRHLKAAGIFARLNHRDGKPGYLKDIPRTLGYIVAVAGRRDELKPLAELIQQQVMPKFMEGIDQVSDVG